jgi:hypothetical protein
MRAVATRTPAWRPAALAAQGKHTVLSMSFQVSDDRRQPLICCDRTLGPTCITLLPLLDRALPTCTVVQETDPFAAGSNICGVQGGHLT